MKGESRERIYMKERLLGLSMTILMLFSVIVSPASAQEVEDPKQPSVDNPHMHFWGTSQMDQCWTHFDRNGTDGSSQDGYGEKEFTGNGEQVDVDFTCRIQSGETFKENMLKTKQSEFDKFDKGLKDLKAELKKQEGL